MEIGAVSSALSAVSASKPGSIANEASMAMLEKTMDQNEVMAQSTIQMMENSVTPHIGGNFDMSI